MKFLSRFALFLIPAAMTTLLSAQDATTYRFQLGLLVPQGDLKSLAGNRIGIDFGMNGMYDVYPGQYLRPRVDLSTFPMFKLSGIQNTASSLSGGVDYIQFLQGTFAPVYLVGGAGLMRWSAEASGTTVLAGTSDTTRFWLALGAGYKVNQAVTWELRYCQSSIDRDFTTKTLGIFLTVKL